MNRLIINADDFGIHHEVNLAVAKAFDQGVLTSTSLLASGPAFNEAVALAAARPGLGIGAHLCLVGSLSPVLAPKEVPSLVDGRGLFPESYGEFMKRVYSGRINYEELYRELDAQLEKIMQQPLQITHVDSHQHLHVLPQVWTIVQALMKKYKLHRLRIPAESYRFKVWTAKPVRVMGRNGLTFLAKRAEKDARRLGFTTTDHFWGMVDGGNMNEANLSYIIKQLPFGVHEIMMHPGLHTNVLAQTFTWGYHWQDELAALLSPAIRNLLQQREIKCIHYGDLP
ncbi:ChbG/HpnK family deacetylase [Megasphaera hominis]|uniref:ChbG/HpnK family deacetylase n=1 Tax=Megasphaera hominis TaxID=159836 RepID=A0ABR6VFC5_9FIRM|nr:ChbG/HpnK family deacetylase [Megasphaera hominis]MBC3535849.1 ChbG/HpnK family deacetylase [Megasphaera hominis]